MLNICLLLSKSSSLWAEWHHHTHMSDRSFWQLEASPNDSWTWNKILELRPLALQFCKMNLGNGRSTSFWYDIWTPLGQLSAFMGPAGPRALRIRNNAMVADAISGTSWSLPHPRSQREVDFHAFLTTIELPFSPDVDDMLEWVAGDSPLRTFRSSTTWEVLRPRHEKHDWAVLIWFKGSVPKHSFTMWVTNYDRLPTRARLAGWGMMISPLCALCSSHDETRDHLILTCVYSRDVWKEVLSRCQSPSALLTNWSELLSWIKSPSSARLALLRKLASHTTIFHLWKQRNNIMHNQISIPPGAVFCGIDREMRNIISARKLRKHFNSLMQLWLR